MVNHDDNLILFLTISRCRVTDHYLPKIRECLHALDHEQLWRKPAADACHAIGATIWHMLEHLRRHTEWLATGVKNPNSNRLENLFPMSGEAPEELLHQAEEIISAWDAAMIGLVDYSRTHGRFSDKGPEMGAIYHLVEHLSYHLGQIVYTVSSQTGASFQFCQHGLGERAMSATVEKTMAEY